MNADLDILMRSYNVYFDSDGARFHRKARILQSMWREEQGYKAGLYEGTPLGNLLLLPWAAESGANFLTGIVCDVVHERLLPDLYDCYNPIARAPHAVEVEAALAERLNRLGYIVCGGH